MQQKQIQATLWFTTQENTTQSISRIFENRQHMLNVARIIAQDRQWTYNRYHIERVIDLSCLNEIEDNETIEVDCEYCNGTGEVGPYGYEYPEYDDCTHCCGTGKEMPEDDPDRKYDTKKELL